ncbi:MAG: GNAT family N-acetyltransferase [Anaerolineales bacterium]|nr:GNAT family N-acetyltransferase [Anaerolineales bacterium]
MTAITAPLLAKVPQLRPLNILNDLLRVANLVEACFADSLDAVGHRYIQQMRRAGKDSNFLRWATTAMDTVSMPLSGYVWEENDEVVGNVSLVPFKREGRKVYLIANVAVRPEYRRKGIGRALTVSAMQHARQRGAQATWLHTRDDNPAAMALYTSLGFRERARRTTWLAKPTSSISLNGSGITVTTRQARDWPQQEAWLQRLYPEELAWYQPISWLSFRPGLGPSLYRFFLDFETRQWAAWSNGQLLGVLAWQPTSGHADRLWAATSPEDGAPALTALLCHARQALTWRPDLALDFPANQVDEAIRSAGFQPRRTLIWMQADATDALDERR